MTEASEAAADLDSQDSNSDDRTSGLCAFGILGILIGVIVALPAAFDGKALLTSFQEAGTPDLTVWRVGHFLWAAWFIWLGIGSIKARRWARTLILATSWYWLLWGTEGFASFLIFGPDPFRLGGADDRMTSGTTTVLRTIFMGLMFVFYVLVPCLSIRFYGSRHVKTTLELREPKIGWTDRCPLPLFVISFIFGVWACSVLSAGFGRGWITTFFGTIVTGATGGSVILIHTVLCGYAAWGFYRRKTQAWWVALLVVAHGIVASFIPVSHTGHTSDQIKMLELHSLNHAMFSGLWKIAFLVYLLYARRFFVAAAPVSVAVEIVDASSGDVSSQ